MATATVTTTAMATVTAMATAIATVMAMAMAMVADAWDAARKIAHMYSHEREKIFGEKIVQRILTNYSASEAIEKIRAYEEKRKAKEAVIKIGDEVEWGDDRYVVTYIHCGEEYVDVIDCFRGSVCGRLAIKGITKTGRNFPEIAEILASLIKQRVC